MKRRASPRCTAPVLRTVWLPSISACLRYSIAAFRSLAHPKHSPSSTVKSGTLCLHSEQFTFAMKDNLGSPLDKVHPEPQIQPSCPREETPKALSESSWYRGEHSPAPRGRRKALGVRRRTLRSLGETRERTLWKRKES